MGGEPARKDDIFSKVRWPLVKESVGEKLKRLYMSQQWSFFNAPIVEEFSQNFADYHDAKYGIFMANGTVTLQCALGACGIGPGDEVIVPSLTWVATATAVHYVGATPVFVDIDKDTLCLDPDKVVPAITKNTKAIIPVHLYGSMADLDKLLDIANRYGLRLIEDCAHMHGGKWNGKGVGSFGDVGSFSFQQSKTMGSGEGGICITSDPKLADRIYRMSHIGYGHGQKPGHAKDSPPQGFICHNFRSTGFEALILNEQLKDLNELITRYNASATRLGNRLKKTTKIRFQEHGRKASPQGFYGWAMIFDDPEYADIPVEILQKALNAEGLPLERTWGPLYEHQLFNLETKDYRIDGLACEVMEQTHARALWLFHALLGWDDSCIDSIAEIIEKVLANGDALRDYSLKAS